MDFEPDEDADLGAAPSRKAATAWNVVLSSASVVLAITRNLLLVPVYLRYISEVEFGAWLATGGILSYLMAADFGFLGAMVQRSAVTYGARRAAQLGRVVGTGLIVALAISGLVFVAAALVSPLVPRLFNLEGELGTRLQYCFLIASLAIGLNKLALAFGAILKSFQRTMPPGITSSVAELLSIVLTVGLLFQGFGLYSIAAGLVARSFLMVVSNGLACLWVCRVRLRIKLGWSRDEAATVWKGSYYIFLTTIAGRLQTSLDPVVVGALLGPQMAGCYVLTIRAYDTARLLIGQWGSALAPPLAHLHGDGKRSRMREIVTLALCVQTGAAAVGIAGVLAFNHAFVSLWVGEHLFAGGIVSVLYGGYILAVLVNGVAYDTMFALGRFRFLCGVVWTTAVLRLAILPGMLLWGLWIVPAAALVSGLVLAVILGPAVAGQLGVGRLERRRVLLRVGKLVFLAPVLAGAWFLLVPPPGSWLVLAIQSTVFAVCAVAGSAMMDRETVRALWAEGRGLLRVRRAR